ncbi:hypothetical protein ACRQ1B_06360 [Rhizobium panacihumi]|uniref:hypothetical protein n=1 Tax=Rhizobium panacihumi TaxID=2008450 RepID=UPI003D7B3CFF
MRTRWDEVDEIEGGSGRFMGFSAITWSLAVPVAFIAGAAVASFFSQPTSDTPALAIPAPAVNASSGNDSRLAAEKSRWEEEARDTAAKAAELQMQVEALRDQVSNETRRRQQAEQAVAQKTTELDQMQQAEAATARKPATTVAVSNSEQQDQSPLSYVAPASTQAFASQSASQPATPSAPQAAQRSDRASDDSIALQRIIEDTASRSAALSDRRDEDEDVGVQTASSQSGRSPRRESEVETALGRATGLDTLSASQRNGLKQELVSGACVTVSLEKVFGNPVPVVPLRNLVRDLDSDC